MKSMEVQAVTADDSNNAKKPLFRKRRYICSDTKCGCCGCCAAWPSLFLFILFLASWGQTFPATKFTNIKYDVDGITLHAYLATPKSPKNNTPAAIMFHAWNGMSEEMTYFADQLAADGYYAIVPDLFRGTATGATNILWNILTVMTTPQERMNTDSDAALKYLKTLGNVDQGRISSGPGFCFGGTQSLVFGSRHKMAATVTCYGTYVKELHDADSKAWGTLKTGGPILGIYGKDDTSPSPKDAEKFGEALEKIGIAHNITIYEGVGHGFIKHTLHKDGDETPVMAWNQIKRFLKGAFQSASTDRRRSLTTLQLNGPEPYAVPLRVSLYHRYACALKCSEDFFTHKGHWFGKRLEK
jgi:carboxymethylenebutenolidase